jgi:phosphohistidine phosphatase
VSPAQDRARRLVVVRHAKSAWPQGVPDLERPLNARGRRDAPALGRWITEHVGVPEAVVCSPAERTRRTWELVATQLRGAGPAAVPDAVVVDRVYAACPRTLLGVVAELPAAATTVLLVAHNPGVEELVGFLGGEAVRMPTSAVAVLEWAGAWSQTGPGQARLRAHALPRG